jgi:hypothetical protein
MAVDTLTRLCSTGQDLTNVTSAGVLSSAWFDMGSATYRKMGGGQLVVASFACSVSLNSSTENATVDLQIVTLPKTSIATATFTAATTDIITATAHGLTAGTRITAASADTLPAGLTASTNYYLRDVTTNTFKVSLTPNGAAVDITDTGTGVHTLTWYPEVLVARQAIGIDRIQAGLFKAEIALPPPQISPRYPYNRYLFARFVPSATLTAGTMSCDLNSGYATDGNYTQPVGYVTA